MPNILGYLAGVPNILGYLAGVPIIPGFLTGDAKYPGILGGVPNILQSDGGSIFPERVLDFLGKIAWG